MNNLDIYEAGREVPLEAQKSFSNGRFSGTDINPMWRIKKLTELFGPAGIGWYFKVISERCEQHADITMSIVDLELFIKVDGEWSMPIYGTGGNQLVKATKNGQLASDEGYKMALTDALSVACKSLGIGADIYFGKDKTKYDNQQQEDQPQGKPRYADQRYNRKGVPCKRCQQLEKITLVDPTIAERRERETGYVLCDDCYDVWAEIRSQDAMAEAANG